VPAGTKTNFKIPTKLSKPGGHTAVTIVVCWLATMFLFTFPQIKTLIALEKDTKKKRRRYNGRQSTTTAKKEETKGTIQEFSVKELCSTPTDRGWLGQERQKRNLQGGDHGWFGWSGG